MKTTTRNIAWSLLTLLTLALTTLPTLAVSPDNLPARRVRNGIIIVDTGATVRAIEPFKPGKDNGAGWAFAVSKYAQTFPDVQVYSMVIPNAVAYYCPDTATTWTSQERPAIEAIHRLLDQRVKAVDIYPVLLEHTAEPIYSRTDHHWSPLGAYYAAQEFARVAGVPFMPLEEYERHVVRDYVGSMYNFSHDKAVKQAPEEFVYYVPQGVDYQASRVVYKRVTKRVRHGRRRYTTHSYLQESPQEEYEFFRDYADGSSAAYCTFMGGDNNTTSVRTSTPGGRRLLILKDSYGNALPGYLFGSFEEIHVVDCRYFTRNIGDFIQRHGITDILFANNLIHASMPRTAEAYQQYLRQ